MVSREELEKDRQDIIAQINRLTGALAYINGKISVLEKEKQDGLRTVPEGSSEESRKGSSKSGN